MGGWIADRLIGQQRSVVWGGVLIMLGNGSLAAGDTRLFFIGLLVIVLDALVHTAGPILRSWARPIGPGARVACC
jgi:hypothetical protein